MTSPTNRDEARERLAEFFRCRNELKHTYGIAAHSSALIRTYGSVPDGVSYNDRLCDDMAAALLSTEEVGGSDQPHPTATPKSAVGEQERFRLLTDPESDPVLKAMLGVRGRAASTFTPEFSGQRFSDYDRGLLDAFKAAQKALVDALSDGAAIASTTDASRAPGTSKNKPAKGGE